MAGPDRALGASVPGAVLVCLFLLSFPSASAGAEGAVAVEVGVVLASNEGTGTDPALAEIRGKLESMFRYTSYRMLDRMGKTLSVDATGEFPIPGGRTMRVTPAPSSGNKVRLAVQILEGPKSLLTTTLGLSRGGMVLVGGPSYRNGTLILIISAR